MSSRCREVAMLVLLLGSCKREERLARPAGYLTGIAGTRLDADAGLSGGITFTGATSAPLDMNPYARTAYDLGEGKRLFTWYNCQGCHGQGGGGIGPALSDARWIYGSEPAALHTTIVQGRPNGMPAFAGKMPEFHVLRLVAYVRSLAGLAGKDVAPGRGDHLAAKPGENTLDPQPILPAGAP
jgi:cytochrome c oxidase cbb3-type subunit 3